jgi:TldD protein
MELYDDGAAERVGTDAADRALRALAAVEPPVGVMPVVLGPAGGGLLLHEACGHGLEGDGLTRGSSVYASRTGRRIASGYVSAVDEPARRLGYGSYGVDDEGTAAGTTLLIDAGVQVGALTDLDSAQSLGRRSANGRRESYAHPPVARMSNTYITPGSDPAGAILGDVRRGVYVVRLKGGDVNITSGDFAFSASEAYLIEDGELTRPLAGLVLLGNSLTALSSVDAVGDDLGFVQALCGKEEQWVPVSYGGPTLRLNGLTVSGGDGA